MENENTLATIKMMAREIRNPSLRALPQGESLTLTLRKAWLNQKNGVDNATILDILVYQEVHLISATMSKAELLEARALWGKKPDGYDNMIWYEKVYFDFMEEAMRDE